MGVILSSMARHLHIIVVICYFLLLFLQVTWTQLCLEDMAVNEMMKNQDFIQSQMSCILEDHDEHCNEFGRQLKRMAPDVFRGNCITPCTKCTQKQIRKVIVLMQQKYPKEFLR